MSAENLLADKNTDQLFYFYLQKQGGCLRESVKRKEGCEEVKDRQEKWLSEEKIEETEKFSQSMSCYYIYVSTLY